MEKEDIPHIVFLQKEKERTEFAQTHRARYITNIAKLLQNALIMKKGMLKMDDLYKLLIMFTFGEPITKKRLLRLKGVTEKLIQKALDAGCIEETEPSDIGEIRYLITEEGQKRL